MKVGITGHRNQRLGLPEDENGGINGLQFSFGL